MDWNRAVERNSEALRKIVAVLFAMLAAAALTLPAPGEVVREADQRGEFTLPRRICSAILLILRPAESAVRRLIVIAARGLSLKPRASCPLPAGLTGFAGVSTSNIASFRLFDPLKHFALDDFDNNALPHFSVHSGDDAEFQWQQSLPSGEPVNATHLFTRLRAIRTALNDIPRQARRLARWQARRDLLLQSNAPFKPMRITPFRPGLPPGWRERRLHEVDDVLRECHGLACDLLDGPDTG